MLLRTPCAVCRRPEGSPCVECVELFAPLGVVTPPRRIQDAYAAIAYVDAARPVVQALKYRNQRSVVTWAANSMVAVLPPTTRPQVVTWAPTTSLRRRERGFDQAELLARAVGRRLGIPARRLLARCPGEAQTGRSAAERRATPSAFRSLRRRVPGHVLLVDDVVTTGSTLEAAATALGGNTDVRITALVLAATPPPGAESR